jgi:hypothetical protein
VVEAGTEVKQSVTNYSAQPGRRNRSGFELNDVLAGLTIKLGDRSIGFTLDERFYGVVKGIQMVVRPL